MNASDHRAAVGEIVDDTELPQRMRRIERRRNESRDERLKLRGCRLSRQCDAYNVAIEIKCRVAFPKCAATRFDGALAESRENQQHAADHHQIRRTIHPQPSGIDCGEAFAFGRSHRREAGSAVARVALRASSVSR